MVNRKQQAKPLSHSNFKVETYKLQQAKPLSHSNFKVETYKF